MEIVVDNSTASSNKAKNRPALWAAVKDAIETQGIGPQILSRFGFGGVEIRRPFLCPRCGANKAKFSSPSFLGGCDGCHAKWPNLIDFLSFAVGRDPSELAAEIGVEFRLIDGSAVGQGGAKRIPSPASPPTPKPAPPQDSDGYCAKVSRFEQEPREIHPKALTMFSEGQGFDGQSVVDIGCKAIQTTARAKSRVIPSMLTVGFPVYGSRNLDQSNWLLRCTCPKDRFISRRWNKQTKSWDVEFHKSTTAYRPQDGATYDRGGIVCSPATRDAIRTGQPMPWITVLRVEGEMDLLAATSMLPADSYLILSPAHGANDTSILHWLLPMLTALQPCRYVIVGDRDRAGEHSARHWAEAIRKASPESDIRVPILPMDYSETHGKDLRDWVLSGATISDFEKLIEKTPSWTEAKKQAEAPKQKAEQQAAPMQSESVNISEHDSQAGQQLQDGSGDGAFSELERKAEESGIQYGDWEEDAGFEEGQAGERAAPSGTDPCIVSFGEMVRQFDSLRPVVIEGLLRETEVANVIASPKVGKSYLVGSMGLSIASGRPWLGMDVAEGEVLFLDNELHPELTTSRLRAIARGMEVDERTLDNMVQVLSLRGRNVDIHTLGQFFEKIDHGRFKLVVIDALYRLLPSGISENDNAAMTSLYNRFDEFAAKLGSAIVLVHHSSKGDQSSKGVTDMGSGAGAISRAADTHIAIRPHEQEGLAVLEAVTRSFKQPAPLSIRWEYPLWQAVTTPPVLRRTNAGQDSRDREADRSAVELFSREPQAWLSYSQVRNQLGFGKDRVERLLKRLSELGTIETTKEERKGDSITVYRLKIKKSE